MPVKLRQLAKTLIYFTVVSTFTFGGVVAYQFMNFCSYKDRIQSILNNTNPVHRNPPHGTIDLLLLSEGQQKVTGFVARRLLGEFDENKQPMLSWHVEASSWCLFLWLYLETEDVCTLWFHFVSYEGGSGLCNLANSYYGLSLDQLDHRELATLIVIARNPSLYKAEPTKLKERVNILLEKYKSKHVDGVG